MFPRGSSARARRPTTTTRGPSPTGRALARVCGASGEQSSERHGDALGPANWGAPPRLIVASVWRWLERAGQARAGRLAAEGSVWLVAGGKHSRGRPLLWPGRLLGLEPSLPAGTRERPLESLLRCVLRSALRCALRCAAHCLRAARERPRQPEDQLAVQLDAHLLAATRLFRFRCGHRA